jgi:hypothetical protein
VSTDGGAPTTSSASTKNTKGGGSESAFCDKVKSYDDKSSDDLSVKDTIKALKDLKASAPSEIKDDLQTVIDFTERLANVDTNDPAALASAYGNIDTDKLSSASNNLDQYVEKNCGITLSS